MSYEGYKQVLCSRGHYWTEDAYEGEAPKCPDCGSPRAWENSVDTTNGSYDDDGTRIDGHVDLKTKNPAIACKCPNCGNEHPSKKATYAIPKGKGHVVFPHESMRSEVVALARKIPSVVELKAGMVGGWDPHYKVVFLTKGEEFDWDASDLLADEEGRMLESHPNEPFEFLCEPERQDNVDLFMELLAGGGVESFRLPCGPWKKIGLESSLLDPGSRRKCCKTRRNCKRKN